MLSGNTNDNKDMDYNLTIANRIRMARERTGLNQSEFARRMKVTPQSVQQWESGETAPRQSRLVELAGLLQVDAQWLLTGQSQDDNELEDVELGLLSFEEADFIKLFRKLPIEQQLLLKGIAHTMERHIDASRRRRQVANGAGESYEPAGDAPPRPRLVDKGREPQ